MPAQFEAEDAPELKDTMSPERFQENDESIEIDCAAGFSRGAGHDRHRHRSHQDVEAVRRGHGPPPPPPPPGGRSDAGCARAYGSG